MEKVRAQRGSAMPAVMTVVTAMTMVVMQLSATRASGCNQGRPVLQRTNVKWLPRPSCHGASGMYRNYVTLRPHAAEACCWMGGGGGVMYTRGRSPLCAVRVGNICAGGSETYMCKYVRKGSESKGSRAHAVRALRTLHARWLRHAARPPFQAGSGRAAPLKGGDRPQSRLLAFQNQIGSRTVTDWVVPDVAFRLTVPVNVCPPAVLTE